MSRADPRWQRFIDKDFTCPCCGRSFGGIFDMAFDHPDVWPHGNRAQSGETELVAGEDRLSADLCRLGEDRFIRCILPLPVIDTGERFAYGVWASLSADSYDRYLAAWDAHDYSDFPGCFGWLCNRPPGWDISDYLPCDVVMGDPGKRPELIVHSKSGHPLATAQREGISFDRLLDLYAAAGTDIRPHLETA